MSTAMKKLGRVTSNERRDLGLGLQALARLDVTRIRYGAPFWPETGATVDGQPAYDVGNARSSPASEIAACIPAGAPSR